ncbi:transposase [Komagataeibacter sp. FXV3]|nr:transposase [Komagataeibacter sp. FXV3]
MCRRHGLSEETFHKRRAKYGGLKVSEAKRLKAFGGQNERLSRSLSADRRCLSLYWQSPLRLRYICDRLLLSVFQSRFMGFQGWP